MSDVEKYLLVFVGILVVCLIVSLLMYKPNIGGQFGFQVQNGTCVKVNEAPHGKTGDKDTVYSNELACMQTLVPNPLGPDGKRRPLGPGGLPPAPPPMPYTYVQLSRNMPGQCVQDPAGKYKTLDDCKNANPSAN